MISRDRTAYDYYGEFFDYTMDGIDSAFFVNKIEYSEPPMALDEYSVLTFDKYKSMEKEKKVMREVEKTYDIIQACHAPHPVRSFRSIEPRDEDFVSDLPEDYLRLYANAEEVHSDRIHACVPTIALGGRCMLHNESLRAPMFEKVTSGNITQQVVRKSGLEEVQREQVEFLADRLTDLDEK
ncbi:hypothetical protein C455_09648 [Haloferax larsenii JCM 13917]|nr:hypothetical protein C455_09648 [Haloferax larsenii JCM 13917]